MARGTFNRITLTLPAFIEFSCFYYKLTGSVSVLDNLKGAISKLRDQPKFQEYVEAKKIKGNIYQKRS